MLSQKNKNISTKIQFNFPALNITIKKQNITQVVFMN